MLKRARSQRAQLGAISSDKGIMTSAACSYAYVTHLGAVATLVTTGER